MQNLRVKRTCSLHPVKYSAERCKEMVQESAVMVSPDNPCKKAMLSTTKSIYVLVHTYRCCLWVTTADTAVAATPAVADTAAVCGGHVGMLYANRS